MAVRLIMTRVFPIRLHNPHSGKWRVSCYLRNLLRLSNKLGLIKVSNLHLTAAFCSIRTTPPPLPHVPRPGRIIKLSTLHFKLPLRCFLTSKQLFLYINNLLLVHNWKIPVWLDKCYRRFCNLIESFLERELRRIW